MIPRSYFFTLLCPFTIICSFDILIDLYHPYHALRYEKSFYIEYTIEHCLNIKSLLLYCLQKSFLHFRDCRKNFKYFITFFSGYGSVILLPTKFKILTSFKLIYLLNLAIAAMFTAVSSIIVQTNNPLL